MTRQGMSSGLTEAGPTYRVAFVMRTTAAAFMLLLLLVRN
jgi:hypothetical protein